MLDPLSLLPLAIAAHGGRVDDFEAQQLVAAGLTLLQRSPALVRALAGKRSAILLPTSPQFLVALGASEGRSALLLDPRTAPFEIAHQLADANVGTVFTVSSLAPALPDAMPRVLLDGAPWRARVVIAGTTREVDLGSHVGLTLEGDPDTPGSEEEAVVVCAGAAAPPTAFTHRTLLNAARRTARQIAVDASDRVLVVAPFVDERTLIAALATPLLTGGAVTTVPDGHITHAAELLAGRRFTVLVARSAILSGLLASQPAAGSIGRSSLRATICLDPDPPTDLLDAWRSATGAEIVDAKGLIVEA